MATLLPRGKIQFINSDGVPLSGGKVYHRIPSTTTPKNTYQDAAGTILNTNPIILDARGEAIVYGSGDYRQTVYDALDNLIWDEQTSAILTSGTTWAGVSGGTANAQTLTSLAFNFQDGQEIQFIPGATNTGSTTLTVNGGSPAVVYLDTAAGPAGLIGGELAISTVARVVYETLTSSFHVRGVVPLLGIGTPLIAAGAVTTAKIAANAVTANKIALGAWTTVASATTVDLGAQTSRNIIISGVTSISSFGSTLTPDTIPFILRFSGTLLLAYNAVNLIIPGAVSITTQPGDIAVVTEESVGVWRVLSYSRASGKPISTVDIQESTTPGAFFWQKPTGLSASAISIISVVGGGGGGGASGGGLVASGGGGGGAGGTRTVLTSTLASTVSGSVGAGGAGASGIGTVGGAGGTTNFDTYLIAYGGGGGTGWSGVGGSGGAGGSLIIAGASATGGVGNTPGLSTTGGGNGGDRVGPTSGGYGIAGDSGGGGGGSSAAAGALGGASAGGGGGGAGAGSGSPVGGISAGAGNGGAPASAGITPGGGGGAGAATGGAGAPGRIRVITFS